ncbi:MAG: hypothetical protein CMF50_01455 [Legionellales bacterium]|nr:hypothetical protein [Legionellales bacterium]|tara:strand:- start:21007 stop:22767 length:1761 start_codon:yes stop_codon:yes gene_type:complete
MAEKHRPTSVTVICWLTIIFAGLSLLATLFSVLGISIVSQFGMGKPSSMTGTLSGVFTFIISLAGFIAAIYTLKCKAWARSILETYYWCGLISMLGTLVVYILAIVVFSIGSNAGMAMMAAGGMLMGMAVLIVPALLTLLIIYFLRKPAAREAMDADQKMDDKVKLMRYCLFGLVILLLVMEYITASSNLNTFSDKTEEMKLQAMSISESTMPGTQDMPQAATHTTMPAKPATKPAQSTPTAAPQPQQQPHQQPMGHPGAKPREAQPVTGHPGAEYRAAEEQQTIAGQINGYVKQPDSLQAAGQRMMDSTQHSGSQVTHRTRMVNPDQIIVESTPAQTEPTIAAASDKPASQTAAQELAQPTEANQPDVAPAMKVDGSTPPPMQRPSRAQQQQQQQTAMQHVPAEQMVQQTVASSATAQTTTSVPTSKSFIETYHNGVNIFKQKDYPGAIKQFDRALAMDPNVMGKPANIYVYRGLAYGYMGNYDKAIIDLKQALERNPKDQAMIMGNLGWVYFKKGDYGQCVNYYNHQLQLQPDSANSYLNRGNCYGRGGDRERGIADIHQACKLGNQSACNFYQRLRPEEKSSM